MSAGQGVSINHEQRQELRRDRAGIKKGITPNVGRASVNHSPLNEIYGAEQ